MSRSEFSFNKKRKHYAYIYKDLGEYRRNILITSKRYVYNRKGQIKYINIPLYHHPNSNKNGQFYVIPRTYIDHKKSFDSKKYTWKWNINDKRKIKRIKKKK